MLVFADSDIPEAAITRLCQDAKQHDFYAVCVRPQYVQLAKSILENTSVQVATVIGFPEHKEDLIAQQKTPTIGQFSLAHKLDEARFSIASGADELDWVLPVAQFKTETQAIPETAIATLYETELKSHYPKTLAELEAAVAISTSRTPKALPVKVIIETDLLSESERILATRLCILAEAHQARIAQVKTSTGMLAGGQGATPDAITTIAKTLQQFDSTGRMGIKASGGVKTREQALKLVELGATRIGTSNGMALLQ